MNINGQEYKELTSIDLRGKDGDGNYVTVSIPTENLEEALDALQQATELLNTPLAS